MTVKSNGPQRWQLHLSKDNRTNGLYCNNDKGKIIPATSLLQAQRVLVGWGSQTSRQSAHEYGKVVRPTHRILSKEFCSDTIGYRTRDLSTCSALPQQTASASIINGGESLFHNINILKSTKMYIVSHRRLYLICKYRSLGGSVVCPVLSVEPWRRIQQIPPILYIRQYMTPYLGGC